MLLTDFDFALPPERIAQSPADPRDSCRLLALDKHTGSIRHLVFRQLPELLKPGDCVVINETRVLPARLHGRAEGSGIPAEVMLLGQTEAPLTWEALVKPGRRLRPGALVVLGRGGEAVGAGPAVRIVRRMDAGRAVVRFEGLPAGDVRSFLRLHGEMPLPPYIKRATGGAEDYQTVYARVEGSVAAPTAGLHFTPSLLGALAARSVTVVRILLHVGYGTFAPLRCESVADNRLEAEYYEVTGRAALEINRCRAAGGQVVAVGTSVTRTLETLTSPSGLIRAGSGWSGQFIYPGHRFAGLDSLLTNFHLPQSSPLLLTAALAGWPHLSCAYREAVAWGYRFYSFGDAMLVS